MKDEATKEVIRSGIDTINGMIGNKESIDPQELHYRLYNTDYFIIGTHAAKEFLEKFGTFDAIEKVKEYEQENFGEVSTDLSDPERIANMFAYIVGYDALNECSTIQKTWDANELSEDDLTAIVEELEAQL